VLEVAELTVRFGDRTVLDRVSLRVDDHRIVALQGPSGSGKSTLLRAVAGLVDHDAGRVLVDGVDVTDLPTHRRGIGMVFQDEQLFPHLDVAANIGFSLRVRGDDAAAVRRRVDELLELVGLPGFGERRIDRLSGGEAKRVALARSLAPEPRVLLLDEPLTGLDAALHDRLADDLRAVLVTAGMSALLVTHDAAEAARVADRVHPLVPGPVPDLPSDP
jgi:thiamine transport system ATP-binding protein